MNYPLYAVRTIALTSIFIVAGCQGAGQPLFKHKDEQLNVGGPLQDSKALSVQVRAALRASPKTMLLRISVSTLSEDSVRLSGYVDNKRILHEAERIASQVDGVRFVFNALNIR